MYLECEGTLNSNRDNENNRSRKSLKLRDAKSSDDDISLPSMHSDSVALNNEQRT